MIIRILGTFLLLLSFSLKVSGHSDTILKIENGAIQGLPDIYSPATFNEKESLLIIGDRQLKLPECIVQLFAGSYFFTASWYHDQTRSKLPPYLSISKDLNGNIKSMVLINLDSLEPIQTDIFYGSAPEDKECFNDFKPRNT